MQELDAFDSKLGDDCKITFCGQAALGNVKNGFDMQELVKYVELINVMTCDYEFINACCAK